MRTRIRAAAFVLAASLGLPAASAAQAVPPPAAPAAPVALVQVDPFLSRVERAGQQIDSDLQAAIEALDPLAVESVELRKTRPLTPAERVAHRQLFVLRARAHVQSMNNEKVTDSLRELLRVDPFYNQPLAPREQELLDGIRTAENGLLEVSSPVRDCTILLDGIEIGMTGDVPVRVTLVSGTYTLRLEKPGHQGAGARVTIAAGQTLTVPDLAPTAQIPPIAFLANREGVEVLVDNAHAGETVRIADLRGKLSAEESSALDQAMALARFDPATSAGFLLRDPPVDRSLSVRFRGECLIEETRTLAITAEALARLDASSPLLWFGDASSIRMRPDVGTLRVTSVPADADVYLDGQLAGRTPFERDVCTGEHRVRIRHRIGSYAVGAGIARGRTEVIDVTLKPGLAYLGAVETVQGTLRPVQDLTSAIDRVLASVVRSFRLATPVDVPPEVQRWSDTSTAELVAASDRADHELVKRLLRQATDNYDAPLVLAAVARGPASAADSAVDLLLFWAEHTGVDRVRVARVTSDALRDVIQQIERPADPMQLVFSNDLGLRLADTLLPEAPLVVASVEPGSPAALAGLKAGDGVALVDGTALTETQVADHVREKKPGDVLTLKLAGATGRQVVLPVQRKPRRAPVFDPSVFGNSIMAKLQAAMATAAGPAERDLLTFSVALVHMRFGQWRQALDLLGAASQVPAGAGVSPAAALYFRARCHQELGERDRALALYREAAAATGSLADDGASVGRIVSLRLGSLGEAPRPPAVR